MEETNDLDFKTFVSKLYTQYEKGVVFEIERDSITKALIIVNTLKVLTRTDLLAVLCALNLLNAAIKSKCYKQILSYATIKGAAAKLISIIDNLKDINIKYFYNIEERCLYYEFDNVIFSFHQVPQTPDILKAAYSLPLKWSGIRLQKIAQPLFEKGANQFDEAIEDDSKNIHYDRLLNNMQTTNNEEIIKFITECYEQLPSMPGWYRDMEKLRLAVNSRLAPSGIDIKSDSFKKVLIEMGATINSDYVDKVTGTKLTAVKIGFTLPYVELTEEEKAEIRKSVVNVLKSGRVKINLEGWCKQEELSLQLNKAGFRKEKYGKKSKNTVLFQQAFGNSLKTQTQGTTVLLKFDSEILKEDIEEYPESTTNSVSESTTTNTASESKAVIVANLFDLGFVQSNSWEILSQLSGVPGLSIKNINTYLTEEPQYVNGAGFPKFPDGTTVTPDSGKFIILRTSLNRKDGSSIIGWYNRDARDKQKASYKGIIWGTEKEFEDSKLLSRKCQVGRMIFKDWEGCKDFFESLNGKIIPEPWSYKNKLDGDFKYPILKSYLQFELDRLFYEAEELNLPGKILCSPDNKMILFNTNLINKYGDDLFIVGKKEILNGKICISELEVAPSKSRLSRCGFSTTATPNPPQFFKDINEIVFHCSWEIDDDMEKREHIIEERIERFPEHYRDLRPDDLGQKLNNAINFATKIAQRNYKFIVPMYYPTKQRIQLLMPIYLDTTYSNHPDFALVLTPCDEAKLYVPETILGLDEVYQDARLIAKPEESWLNPNMIK